MGLLSRLFGSKDGEKGDPSEQEVEVHFAYGSTNFQHVRVWGPACRMPLPNPKLVNTTGTPYSRRWQRWSILHLWA